jgi:hypothetical protein
MTEAENPPFLAVFETVAYDHRKLITVVGDDPDAVWSEALDRKNAQGFEHAFEARGLQQSEHAPGLWLCVLIERTQAPRCPCQVIAEARAGGLQ